MIRKIAIFALFVGIFAIGLYSGFRVMQGTAIWRDFTFLGALFLLLFFGVSWLFSSLGTAGLLGALLLSGVVFVAIDQTTLASNSELYTTTESLGNQINQLSKNEIILDDEQTTGLSTIKQVTENTIYYNTRIIKQITENFLKVKDGKVIDMYSLEPKQYIVKDSKNIPIGKEDICIKPVNDRSLEYLLRTLLDNETCLANQYDKL